MNKKTMIMVASIVLIISLSTISANVEFKGAGDENTVKIGYIPTDHEAALFVAQAKGLYEDKNISIDLIKYNNGGDLMTAMDKGEIDVGYVGIAPALSSIHNGTKAKIISSAQNEGSGIIVSKDSGIKTADDMKGKNIATIGDASIQHLLLSYYLQENNVSIDDLNVSTIKASEMNDALEKGEIDGMVTYQPYITLAQKDGNTVLEESSKILPNHPCCVVVASDDFIDNHKEEAKGVLDAHKEATSFINDNIKKGNTDEVAKLLPDDVVPDKQVEAESLESYPFTSGMSSNFKADVDKFQDLEVSLGIIDDKTPQDKLFWEA